MCPSLRPHHILRYLSISILKFLIGHFMMSNLQRLTGQKLGKYGNTNNLISWEAKNFLHDIKTIFYKFVFKEIKKYSGHNLYTIQNFGITKTNP